MTEHERLWRRTDNRADTALLAQRLPEAGRDYRSGGSCADARRRPAVIDRLIFHRIGENQTNRTRTSMTLGYRSVDDLAGLTEKSELVCGGRVYRGNDGDPQPMRK